VLLAAPANSMAMLNSDNPNLAWLCIGTRSEGCLFASSHAVHHSHGLLLRVPLSWTYGATPRLIAGASLAPFSLGSAPVTLTSLDRSEVVALSDGPWVISRGRWPPILPLACQVCDQVVVPATYATLGAPCDGRNAHAALLRNMSCTRDFGSVDIPSYASSRSND